ncbi:hypothetical protein BH18THE2_BH18THE2_10820 [soil metagenome]
MFTWKHVNKFALDPFMAKLYLTEVTPDIALYLQLKDLLV